MRIIFLLSLLMSLATRPSFYLNNAFGFSIRTNDLDIWSSIGIYTLHFLTFQDCFARPSFGSRLVCLFLHLLLMVWGTFLSPRVPQ